MQKAEYGRIVNISSYSGIYGSFGQANYSFAKMGVIGFTKTLAQEGKKSNIKVNAVAPVAATDMLATVMSQESLQVLSPELVAPLVAYLSHEYCMDTGQIFEVGGGHISKLRLQRSKPINLKAEDFNMELISSLWPELTFDGFGR